MDLDIGEGSSDNTTDPICSWVEVVEPVTPEDRKLGVRTNDTVEKGEDDEEKGKNVGDNGE